MGGTETMNKTQQAITASLAGLVMLLAVSPAFAADAEVKIANFTFDPPVLTVKAGTTVTWVNGDDIPHVIAEKDGKFRSGALDTDDSFSQSFARRKPLNISTPSTRILTGKIIVTP